MAAPPPPPTTTTGETPYPPTQRTLRIGTRSSALALAQVALFTTLLPPSLPTTTLPSHTALGDIDKSTNLHTLASGGKSLWTEDLETELREGRVDVIIHSMKDVPTQISRDFRVAAVGAREEARDALVMNPQRTREGKKKLGDLPEGSVIGTSSVRRAAMIRRTHPHLCVADVRGNVHTRLRKLDDPAKGFDALVLAGAGVQRLGLGERISSWLGRGEGVLHAVGQGALGVEWRAGDGWVEGLLGDLGRGKGGREGRRVRWECVVERGVLRALEGGCSVPVGVECQWEEGTPPKERAAGGEGKAAEENEGFENDDAIPDSGHNADADGGYLVMRAMVVSLDGKECVEGEERCYVSNDAEGEECAMRMYKQLVEKGAEKILKEITLNRGMIRGQDGA